MRVSSPLLWKFIAAILVIPLLSGGVLAQSGGAGQAALISPPTVQDDQITFQVVVKNANGLPVPNLTAENFSLSEPVQDLHVESQAALPIALAVIVDLSSGSDIDLIQNSLHAYFNDYYQPGDPVTFYLLGPDQKTSAPQVVEPKDKDEINGLIDGLKPSPRFYSISQALTESLEKLRSLASVSRPAHALYVGSFLNDPSEASQSTPFKLAGIPFHVVQAHRYRHPATAALQKLAANGGGLFADNVGGTSILDSATAVNLVKIIYDAIATSRQVYTISYRTLNQSLVAQHDITLIINFSSDSQVTLDFTYQRDFSPPEVSIIAANLTPVRLPSRQGDAINFDVSRQPVTVSVKFPDGVLRKIASLRLEVTSTASGNTLQSSLQAAPAPDSSGNYAINWALDDFTTPSTTTDVEIKVTATDELGLEGEATAQGRVTVGALPPPPTLIPTATLVPTETPLPPTETPSPTTLPTAAANSASPFASAQNSLTNAPILLGVIIILLVISLVSLILLIRQKRLRAEQSEELEELRYHTPPPGDTAPQTAAPPPPNPDEEEKTIYGRLVVIEGLDEKEILLDQEEFIIGRSAESGCHYVLNLPFISPRHCMIIHHEGSYGVRDPNSKNGVFINGERIPRDREVVVPIGSEVGITERLKMELWDPFTEVNLETRRAGTSTAHTTTHANTSLADLSFRPLPGIQYAEDDGSEVDDNYSPI